MKVKLKLTLNPILLSLMTVAAICKLTGVINWSWWLVFLPITVQLFIILTAIAIWALFWAVMIVLGAIHFINQGRRDE